GRGPRDLPASGAPPRRRRRFRIRAAAKKAHGPAGCRRSLMRVARSALIVVDVQKGFDDLAWGARNNPDCERNIGALIGTWRERGLPVVFVRHDGVEEESPYDTLGREHPGNAFKEVLESEPDLLVTKHVNSSFHGSPDLEAWLRANGVDAITVCGIQTQMCCETT